MAEGVNGRNRYVVIDADPEVRNDADIVRQPRTPYVNVADAACGCAGKIVAKADLPAIQHIPAAVNPWRLNVFYSVGLRAKCGLRPGLIIYHYRSQNSGEF